jgi:ubiquinone/menaquinone biosynthesis C-methylase UbiE
MAVGIYSERVLPRLMNVACGSKQSRPLRERVCAGLHGEVVEIGFGSGHNVPFYPDTVRGVAAVEPSELSWRLARDRVSASTATVERAGRDGQSLPFPDHSFDAALSTWTLCTIPDPVLALTEVRRVLRPGGTLHFLEHGLAPDESVRRWQRRLEPLNSRLAGGCHLTRPILDLLETAGFRVEHVDVFYEAGAPKPMVADSLGLAVAS